MYGDKRKERREMKKRFRKALNCGEIYLGMFLGCAVLSQAIYFREKIIDFFVFLGTVPGKGESITALGALATLLPITFFYFLWRYSFIRVFKIYQDDSGEDFVIPQKSFCFFQRV